jgi:hypothetical protein
MALADFAGYKAALDAAIPVTWTKNALTCAASNLESYWVIAPLGGTTPSTAAAPSRSTTGNLWQTPQSAGAFANALYAAQVEIEAQWAGFAQTFILIDRLSHQGGLSGTVGASEQTTNLPTAALTRYTDGVGVMAALEWYTQTGATAVTVTARYTNQAGTGSRTTKVQNVVSNRVVDSFAPLCLQDGDTGVRSVEGVTLSASTLTAGNFGVTLFKPLMIIPGFSGIRNFKDNFFAAALEEIHDDACLSLLAICSTTSIPAHVGTLKVIEVA